MARLRWRLAFLELLERHGEPCKAADQVGVDRTTPYKLKARDDDFAAKWDAAIERYLRREAKEAAKRLDLSASIFL